MTTRNAPGLLALMFASTALIGCGGGGGGTASYTVNASVTGNGGSIDPASRTVNEGVSAEFTVTADSANGYVIDAVTSNCGEPFTGSNNMTETTYTTGAVKAECTVEASFKLATYSVSTAATMGGSITVASPTVNYGGSTTFTVAPDVDFDIASVLGSGCTVEQVSGAYTVSGVTADCAVTASFALRAGATPVSLGYDVKELTFSWAAVSGASHYRLWENLNDGSGYTQVGGDMTGTAASRMVPIHLYSWGSASYEVEACNGSTDSDCITLQTLTPSLADAVNAIGYLKASNAEADDELGEAIALSGDGRTLAVTAPAEDGDGSSESNNSASGAGAVYVFTLGDEGWVQQAYLKASNAEAGDGLYGVALSDDGNTLAVGAPYEDGDGSSQGNNSASNSGAVYVFTRSGGQWSQQAYLKAGNVGAGDLLGNLLALSGDGNTLAVGVDSEDGSGTDINATPDDLASDAGAAYVFVRSGEAWSQEGYIKGSNTGAGDRFGRSVALSDNGNTLAVGANNEDGSATEVNGTDDDAAGNAGAAYIFVRDASGWTQQAYVKAPNAEAGDGFGGLVLLSDNGDTLAVGASGEDGATQTVCAVGDAGCPGAMADNGASGAGAVYLFGRTNGQWSAHTYVKASNSEVQDGIFLGSLSGDGSRLAIGSAEDSSATGICPTDVECATAKADNSAADAGAVYLFSLANGRWSETAYIKAPNASADHWFASPALSDDGTTLAVGAVGEGSAARGICATGQADCAAAQSDDSASWTGAVYLY